MNVAIEKTMSKMNVNTILLIAGMALVSWLSQYFVTKDSYEKDQARMETSLRDLNLKQDRMLDILLEDKRGTR